MSYFKYHRGFRMTSQKFTDFWFTSRNAEDKLTQFHMDLASSIQAVTEEIVIKIIFSERNGYSKYLLAGGLTIKLL